MTTLSRLRIIVAGAALALGSPALLLAFRIEPL